MSEQNRTTPIPLIPIGAITREALVEAMQTAWDDFCADTGCHPDCFFREGRNLGADFQLGNFATQVAAWLQVTIRERLKV